MILFRTTAMSVPSDMNGGPAHQEAALSVRPSRRVASLGGYAFDEMDREVARLREAGIRPVDFGVGDPTLPTPEFISRAAAAAVETHRTSGYPSYVGDETFRMAASSWMNRRFGIEIDPLEEITATLGSKEAVFNIHEGFVDPGDLVISPSPGYPPYARGCLFAEGENWFYPIEERNGFLPDLDDVPTVTARKARLFWICNPVVPAGRVTPPGVLDDLAAFCREYDILLCSDEAYSELYFTKPPRSILQHAREGVLAFFSLSKRSAMTGYRCGWVAGDREAIAVFRKVKTNIDSGTPRFIQDAASAALGDEDHVRAMRDSYGRKREIMVQALEAAGFPRCSPEAGLYIWQRVPQEFSGLDVARLLAQPEIAVLATPGEWLAEPLEDGRNPGSDFIRFALVPPLDEVEEAARRLERWKGWR